MNNVKVFKLFLIIFSKLFLALVHGNGHANDASVFVNSLQPQSCSPEHQEGPAKVTQHVLQRGWPVYISTFLNFVISTNFSKFKYHEQSSSEWPEHGQFFGVFLAASGIQEEVERRFD